MKKFIFILLFLFSFSIASADQYFTGGVIIEESDSSPSVQIWQAIFPNGSVTDNLDGTVTINFSSIYIPTGTAWLTTGDQSSLSGTKSGTFNLSTTGTLGAGAITGTSLTNNGALYESITSTSDATYTVLSTDRNIYVTASTGNNKTVALPAATGTGRILQIKKVDTSVATVTVDGNSSETIDGAITYVLSIPMESITIQDVASGIWYII